MKVLRLLGFLLLLFCAFHVFAADANEQVPVGDLSDHSHVILTRLSDSRYSIVVKGESMASRLRILPVRIELKDPILGQKVYQQGYDRYNRAAQGRFQGEGQLQTGGVRFLFEDNWQITDDGLTLNRRVTVQGQSTGGFMSSLVLNSDFAWKRNQVQIFVPGMIYGGTDHMSDWAIGGSSVYANGHGIVRIREDRMPGPLFGIHFKDNSAVTLSDLSPRAGSTLADSNDNWEWNDVQSMIDSRFQFGALGEDESGGWNPTLNPEQVKRLQESKTNISPEIGFWMPGSEGEMTYGTSGVWRRRFHPLDNGFSHQYNLRLSIDRGENFLEYQKNAWRREWEALNPQPARIDVAVARHSIESMLLRVAVHGAEATGLPFFIDAARGDLLPDSRYAFMGFLGRNLQAADMLLYDADHGGQDPSQLRQLGTEILDSFAKLNMAPPESDGIWFDSGRRVEDYEIFLRSPSEDLYFMLSAWHREKQAGRDHQAWFKRPMEFANWILQQQTRDGGFPRAWKQNSTTVAEASTLGSYNPIPLLVEIYQLTHERKYLDAAIRAGDLCWSQGQREGVFVGGTIDHPNIIDKEAGTLSLNAYLKLYEATKDNKWLGRAQAAADYSETWIYIWDVEMPEDATDGELPWKKGVSTIGLQPVATGDSYVDEYMCGDVANYAKLYKYTGDHHYFEVARILLKNTKNMMGLPGRTYDLVGPGWQQEGFNLSQPRNFMQHRVWLPWISVTQLGGIVQTEEFDPALFDKLSAN